MTERLPEARKGTGRMKGLDMKMHGPFEIDLKVHITDGKQVGVLTWQMPAAKIPSRQDVKDALTTVEEGLSESVGDGWRLCSKREYFDNLMFEKTGSTQRFALPGGDDWDASA